MPSRMKLATMTNNGNRVDARLTDKPSGFIVIFFVSVQRTFLICPVPLRALYTFAIEDDEGDIKASFRVCPSSAVLHRVGHGEGAVDGSDGDWHRSRVALM